VHLPIVLCLQQYAIPAMPASLRFPLALGITAALSLGSYELLQLRWRRQELAGQLVANRPPWRDARGQI